MPSHLLIELPSESAVALCWSEAQVKEEGWWRGADTFTVKNRRIGIPKTRLSPLQTVLNAAARLIARFPRYSHISYYIKEHLHWLPISTRIEYKVLLIVLKAQMGVPPKYLRDAIRLPTSATSLRPLRSMDRRELYVPRTRTTMAMSRCFPL